MSVSLTITIDIQSANIIPTVLAEFQRQGKNIRFAKSAQHLDIDTPNKDSYELFEAGLDFVMLVTNKQRYLKSRYDVSRYLPLTPDIDWIIQDSEVYPADIQLSATNTHLFNSDGTIFPLNDLSTLITWLEACHEQKNNNT